MNDFEINRYMEMHYMPQGRAAILDYVRQHNAKDDEPWFAICLNDGDFHIGNIKICPINYRHRSADISYFIGEKQFWGKGYATEAISLAVRFAFDTLDLYKLNAGTYAANKGSQAVLEKNGFVREGVFKEQVFFEGGRDDAYRYGLTVTNYRSRREKR